MRAESDVRSLLKGAVVIRDEEITICRLKLVPKYGALEMQRNGHAISHELRTVQPRVGSRIKGELREFHHGQIPSGQDGVAQPKSYQARAAFVVACRATTTTFWME